MPLHPIITVGPFCKWAIDFMTCNPPLDDDHKYIIMAIEYFTKWVEAMPTFNCKDDTATLFFFNHVIACFSVPLQLVSDHGSHFEDAAWTELCAMFKFEHQCSLAYYPKGNSQIEVFNKILKTMLQRMVDKYKCNLNHFLFSTLWDDVYINEDLHRFYPISLGPWCGVGSSH